MEVIGSVLSQPNSNLIKNGVTMEPNYALGSEMYRETFLNFNNEETNKSFIPSEFHFLLRKEKVTEITD